MTYSPCAPFAETATDRRHRHPLHAAAGLIGYERHTETMRPAGRERPMGRVLRLDATGLWVIRLGGELAEIDGHCYWDTLDNLQGAAKKAGIPLSDLTIHTGRSA